MKASKLGKSKMPTKSTTVKNKKSGKSSFATATEDSDSDDYNDSEQPTGKWYDSVPKDPEEYAKPSAELIKQLQEDAERYMASEVLAHSTKTSKNSEKSWMRTVMAKGTGRDKLAAFTLMVQEEPLYNLQALRSLLGLVRLGKKENTVCIDTLVELFLTDLLPLGHKLKPFSQRPLTRLDELSSGNEAGRRKRLVAWYFEDQLKQIYGDFIESLKKIATEAVDANKLKAVFAMAKLLQNHPEQEAALLANLVNKLGDPTKKVAAKTVGCLLHVLRQHPNMKAVIIDEIEKLLFRPNIGQKARFYAICLLTQILFTKNDAQLAASLIKLYFSFFKACVKQGDVDSRMLSALLTGVNRAYPYAQDVMDSMSEQMETMYKVVHLAPFGIAMHGLSLLFLVADYKNSVSDRFYCVLYRKILDPALSVSTNAAMFLNLVYRALKKDENIFRVRAFIKRLLQVCCGMSVPVVCGLLYAISQLIRARPLLAASVLNAPAVKVETPSNQAGSTQAVPSGPQALPAAFLEDDSEDEHYEDVKMNEDGTVKEKKVESSKGGNLAGTEGQKTDQRPVKHVDRYDSSNRNPLFAGGEFCCYVELLKLTSHFHPSVAVFASQILNGEQISYSGDPLKDFTLGKFLERFVFKNPKKTPESHNTNLFAKRNNYKARGLKAMPITSKSYINQEEGKVPVDERFVYRYLQSRRQAVEKKEEDEEASDIESIDDDEFDNMLQDVMAKRGFKADIDDDEAEEDINFADEYRKNISAKKKKKKDDDEESLGGDDDEVDEDEGLDGDEDLEDDDDDMPANDDLDADLEEDEEMDRLASLGDDDDFGNVDDLDDLDDEEVMDFGDDEEEEEEMFKTNIKKGKKNNKQELASDVFAPAEEFSELLEAAGAARSGSLSALANKDKASLKQIAWESNRDRWVKGFDRHSKGGNRGKKTKKFKGPNRVNKGKPLGVKKPSFKKYKK